MFKIQTLNKIAACGLDRLPRDCYESATEIVRTGPEATLVRRVGERIAEVADDPGFAWEFTLIASPTKNAWCLPGGKVAIYSGILEVAQDEEGLAVVMAHEIAHAIAQHGAELMTATPDVMEAVLADTVLGEFKTRLGRIGIEYQSPKVPA